MNQESINALKTCGGGIFHSVRLYNTKDFGDDHNFGIFLSHLKLPPTAIYSIERTGNGFILYTRTLTLKYMHSDWSPKKRKIELTY